jgi:cytochrome c peroxidase
MAKTHCLLVLLCSFALLGCGNEVEPTAPVATKKSETSNVSDVQKQLVKLQPAVHREDVQEDLRAKPALPPLAALPAVPVPADNPLSEAKIELGKLLFFDDRLSGDVGTSCASCHDPRIGWGDGNALSRGYAGTQHWRNSQTIVNSAYLAKLFWAGESPSLEAQAASAIGGNLAGNGDSAMIEERLAQIPVYVRLFKEAFGVREPSYELALKAIASFERAETISNDSPFDRYMRGEQTAMSEGALRGMELFVGKANCIRCHNGALLSDERYHNLGLPKNPLYEQDPLRQIALRYQHYIRGVPEHVYRTADRDLGLYYTTKRDGDKGKFRTPPLRYLVYTAPYMHNGVFETLEDVIDFYDDGGGDAANRSPLLEPLNLTEDEKFDLLEFLEALSGDEIRVSLPVLPPYEVIPEFVESAE